MSPAILLAPDGKAGALGNRDIVGQIVFLGRPAGPITSRYLTVGQLDLEMKGNKVVEFSEKPQTREGWINGAFFVLEPEVVDYIDDDKNVQWERGPLQRLARDGQLMAYKHESFWQCMDTLRDKRLLEELWDSGDAPWKVCA